MLQIPPDIRDQITRHAQSTYPLECCGILLGVTRASRPHPPTAQHRQQPPTVPITQPLSTSESVLEIHLALPAENLAAPETRHNRYLIDPRAILEADLTAQKSNLEILGFYHSHPNHPPIPSPTDNALAWPDYIYLICAIAPEGTPDLRAYRLENTTTGLIEIPVFVVPPLGGVGGDRVDDPPEKTA